MFPGCIVKIEDGVLLAYTMNVSFIWQPHTPCSHAARSCASIELKDGFAVTTVKYDSRAQSV